MSDQIRGPDAADHAPKPAGAKPPAGGGPTEGKMTDPAQSGEQDAPNYDQRVDQGLAEPVEVMNSANDE